MLFNIEDNIIFKITTSTIANCDIFKIQRLKTIDNNIFVKNSL